VQNNAARSNVSDNRSKKDFSNLIYKNSSFASKQDIALIKREELVAGLISMRYYDSHDCVKLPICIAQVDLIAY